VHCAVSFPPAWNQAVDFTVDWMRLEESRQEYRRLIAPARTFGFKQELDELARRGLALGGTLDNALLLDGDQVVNEGGFKLPQELAAHKLLDALGDFALLGAPLLARIVAEKAGHSMHLRALAEAARTGALVSGSFAADGTFVRDV
jgi:UDP-3-O-[3-hydroxymyristoyl] N-acetylglucosamine deacetylase